MKYTAMTALAVLVMAVTGCESGESAVKRLQAIPRQPYKMKFQPGTDMMGIAPSTVVFNEAPAPAPQPTAPTPVIVTPPGGGTTVATQVGNSTIVSQFNSWQPPIGGYRPVVQPAPYPYYGY